MLFGSAAELAAPSLVDADAWFDRSDAGSTRPMSTSNLQGAEREVITLVLPGRKMFD
jgi:hypothetical protein